MTRAVEVRCGYCHEIIGLQLHPGDGLDLFRLHLIELHPELVRADGGHAEDDDDDEKR